MGQVTMSNIAFLFLPLAFSSLPAVLPFVSPSSQVETDALQHGVEIDCAGVANLPTQFRSCHFVGPYHVRVAGAKETT